MLVTLATSQLEMSPLNLSAPGMSFQPGVNKLLISVTPETTQDPIGPGGPLVQPKSDACMHATTAARSSVFALGANTLGVVVVVVHIIFPDEPENMPDLPLAVDLTHAPQSVWEKDFAPWNMESILVTLDTSHLERSALNDEAPLNMESILVTLDTTHLEMSPLNDAALVNISCMMVTLDTPHFEMSPLNDVAP